MPSEVLGLGMGLAFGRFVLPSCRALSPEPRAYRSLRRSDRLAVQLNGQTSGCLVHVLVYSLDLSLSLPWPLEYTSAVCFGLHG